MHLYIESLKMDPDLARYKSLKGRSLFIRQSVLLKDILVGTSGYLFQIYLSKFEMVILFITKMCARML